LFYSIRQVDKRPEWAKARVNLALALLAKGMQRPALTELRRAVALGETSDLALINLSLLTLKLEWQVQRHTKRKAGEIQGGLDRKTLGDVLRPLQKAAEGSQHAELAHCVGCVLHALALNYLAVAKQRKPDPLSIPRRAERRLQMTPSWARSALGFSNRAECDELFQLIDADGDGTLTKSEIKQGLEAIKESTGLARSAAKIFQGADVDGSKLIDPDEFFLFMQAAMEEDGLVAAGNAPPERELKFSEDGPFEPAVVAVSLGKTVEVLAAWKVALRSAHPHVVPKDRLLDLLSCTPPPEQKIKMLADAGAPVGVNYAAAVGIDGDLLFDIEVSSLMQTPHVYVVRRSVVQFVNLLEEIEHLASIAGEGVKIDDQIMVVDWCKQVRRDVLKKIHAEVDMSWTIIKEPGSDMFVDNTVRAAKGVVRTQRESIGALLQKCPAMGVVYRTAILRFLDPADDRRAAAATFIQTAIRGRLGRDALDRLQLYNRLMDFYSEHVPEQLGEVDVDALLNEWRKRELALLTSLDREHVWPKLKVDDIAARLSQTFAQYEPARMREVDALLDTWRGDERGLLLHYQEKYLSSQTDLSWRGFAVERRRQLDEERARHTLRRPIDKVTLVGVTETITDPLSPPPPKGTMVMTRVESDMLFRKIDTDGDGQLTKQEIKTGVERIKESTGLAQSAKKIWKGADADNSKKVDEDEFFLFMLAALEKEGPNAAKVKAEMAPPEPELEPEMDVDMTALFRGLEPLTLTRADSDKLFAQIDKNGDGELTHKEIKDGIKQIKTTTRLAVSAKNIWKGADVDDDRKVDAMEFFAFMSRAVELENERQQAKTTAAAAVEIRAEAAKKKAEEDALLVSRERLPPPPPPPPPDEPLEFTRKDSDELFDMIDKDGDGQLTQKEIKKGLRQIKAATGLAEKAKAIFKAADASGDKKIDIEEFFTYMRKVVDREMLARRIRAKPASTPVKKKDGPKKVYVKTYKLEVCEGGKLGSEPFIVEVGDLELLRLLGVLDGLLADVTRPRHSAAPPADPALAKKVAAEEKKKTGAAKALMLSARQVLEGCSGRPEELVGLAKISLRRKAVTDVLAKLPVLSAPMQHAIWRMLPRPGAEAPPPPVSKRDRQAEQAEAARAKGQAAAEAAATVVQERKAREEQRKIDEQASYEKLLVEDKEMAKRVANEERRKIEAAEVERVRRLPEDEVGRSVMEQALEFYDLAAALHERHLPDDALGTRHMMPYNRRAKTARGGGDSDYGQMDHNLLRNNGNRPVSFSLHIPTILWSKAGRVSSGPVAGAKEPGLCGTEGASGGGWGRGARDWRGAASAAGEQADPPAPLARAGAGVGGDGDGSVLVGAWAVGGCVGRL
jgi:Ca2+-binding EF-hand superfamily protein